MCGGIGISNKEIRPCIVHVRTRPNSNNSIRMYGYYIVNLCALSAHHHNSNHHAVAASEPPWDPPPWDSSAFNNDTAMSENDNQLGSEDAGSCACGYGGICTADSVVSTQFAGPDGQCDCMPGWVGRLCATVDDLAWARVAVTTAAALVGAVLVASLVVVVVHSRWLPICARGPGSLITSFVGGACWIISAVTWIAGDSVS